MTDPAKYTPGFLTPSEAETFFRAMMEHVDWERRDDAPRYEYWSNDRCQPYTYGRARGQRTYQHRIFPMAVLAVRERLQQVTGWYFEGCFCNRYDTSRDWLGWHSDDDPGIDHSKPIAVVTLGNARAIQYRPIVGVDETVTTLLEPGSLFMMAPGMQQTHLHRIPKADRDVGPRVSLTFRSLLPPGG